MVLGPFAETKGPRLSGRNPTIIRQGKRYKKNALKGICLGEETCLVSRDRGGLRSISEGSPHRHTQYPSRPECHRQYETPLRQVALGV